MNPKRIIFLDIDGVLINEECLRAGNQNAHPDCVAALNWLTRQSGAGLVVTSTWRIRGFGYIQTMFRRWHIDGQVIDMTPRMEEFAKPGASFWKSAGREAEIREWFRVRFQRSDERVEYVILDDEPGLIGSLVDRLVQTTHYSGLTMKEAQQALEMLSSGSQKAE